MDLAAFGELIPWLVDLADGARIREALRADLPEARAGGMEILACRPSRLRLKGRVWTGRYELTVRSGADAEERSVRLTGTTVDPVEPVAEPPATAAAFGAPSWRTYLPALGLNLRTEPVDAALPALPVLTDPESARDLLERAIGGAGPAYDGYRLRACRPQVVRYKPGSRCTVRFVLEYGPGAPPPGWPDVVVAKTYGGHKGQVAWDGMRALWQSPMASSGVRIAEPLAFLPDLNVLVQGPVPEQQTLKDAMKAAVAAGDPAGLDRLHATVRATAAGLVALHGSGVQHGGLVTWDDELAEVRGVVGQLAGRVPELGQVAEPLFAALAERAAAEPADPPGPAHGSFRPGQVLMSDGQLGFIDFDGFCRAEPALDLAQFRTTVQQLGSRAADVATFGRVADEFLAEYVRLADVSPVRIALWESLYLLTRVLNCWTKVKPGDAQEALAALQAQLAAEPLNLS